ncbi:MAG TPA: hypothetical protein VHP37_21130 [Burkholderiales bacterium]|nr:hypothetical protein [Burkholderiales bacterium]
MAVAAIAAWIVVGLVASVQKTLAALLGIVAYGVSIHAVYEYSRSHCSSTAREIPTRVSIVIALWLALHFLPFELRERALLRLYNHAETHGWFVAVMFAWGIICIALFLDKTKNARAKATSLIFVPLVCFLAFGVIHGALPEGSGPFYFLGGILVAYVAVFISSHLAEELEARFVRKPPSSEDPT